MSTPVSANEVFLREHLKTTRHEIEDCEKEIARLEGKYSELSEVQKQSPELAPKFADWNSRVAALRVTLTAKRDAVDKLDVAIREAIVAAAVNAIEVKVPPPVVPVATAPKIPELPHLDRTFFYGKNGDSVEDWIKTFKGYCLFYADRLSTFVAIEKELHVHLRADAFAWYEDRHFESVESFFDALRAEFGERLAQDKVVAALVTMAPTATLAEYVRQFRCLYKKLDVSRRDLIWVRFAFLSNVPDVMLSSVSTKIMQARTPEEMFDCCQDSGFVSGQGDSCVAMDLDALTKNDFESVIKCFKCSGFGHAASQCPSKKKDKNAAGPSALRDK
jgi:hypothetical protein